MPKKFFINHSENKKPDDMKKEGRGWIDKHLEYDCPTNTEYGLQCQGCGDNGGSDEKPLVINKRYLMCRCFDLEKSEAMFCF